MKHPSLKKNNLIKKKYVLFKSYFKLIKIELKKKCIHNKCTVFVYDKQNVFNGFFEKKF